jgi:hypothetical protein
MDGYSEMLACRWPECFFADDGLGMGRILGYLIPTAVVILLIIIQVRHVRWKRRERQRAALEATKPPSE